MDYGLVNLYETSAVIILPLTANLNKQPTTKNPWKLMEKFYKALAIRPSES
jgi:hypothetical protein